MLGTAQVAYAPNDDFSAYLNWIGGDETSSSVSGDSTSSYKHMFDLTTAYDINKKISIGINASIGFNSYDTVKTNWGGVALYLQYNVNERLGVGVRTELFDDTEGSQYLGANYTGITLTASYTSKSGAVTVKPEIRYDGASKNIYYSGENNALVKSQITLGVAFIGKF